MKFKNAELDNINKWKGESLVAQKNHGVEEKVIIEILVQM